MCSRCFAIVRGLTSMAMLELTVGQAGQVGGARRGQGGVRAVPAANAAHGRAQRRHEDTQHLAIGPGEVGSGPVERYPDYLAVGGRQAEGHLVLDGNMPEEL